MITALSHQPSAPFAAKRPRAAPLCKTHQLLSIYLYASKVIVKKLCGFLDN